MCCVLVWAFVSAAAEAAPALQPSHTYPPSASPACLPLVSKCWLSLHLLSQELASDPLGILRPASKLQHQLPLASAYAAVAAAPDADHGMQRQKRRLDPATGEPKCALLGIPFGFVFYLCAVMKVCATPEKLRLGVVTSDPECCARCLAVHLLTCVRSLRGAYRGGAWVPAAATAATATATAAAGRQPTQPNCFYCFCRFTNITRDFRGTLDYILYTTDSLAPAAALELPDESECRSKSNAGGPVSVLFSVFSLL